MARLDISGAPSTAVSMRRPGDENPFVDIHVGFASAPAVDDFDLFVGNALGIVRFFDHIADGRLVERTSYQDLVPNVLSAHRVAPVCGDWDGDEDVDIVIGSLNERLLFFDRTLDTDTDMEERISVDPPCNCNGLCDEVSFWCLCITGYEGDDCSFGREDYYSAVTDMEIVSWWNAGVVPLVPGYGGGSWCM